MSIESLDQLAAMTRPSKLKEWSTDREQPLTDAISDAFNLLLQSQKSLEPDFARSLKKRLWSLYAR